MSTRYAFVLLLYSSSGQISSPDAHSKVISLTLTVLNMCLFSICDKTALQLALTYHKSLSLRYQKALVI
jgi:hypothetical protein